MSLRAFVTPLHEPLQSASMWLNERGWGRLGPPDLLGPFGHFSGRPMAGAVTIWTLPVGLRQLFSRLRRGMTTFWPNGGGFSGWNELLPPLGCFGRFLSRGMVVVFQDEM